VKFSELNMCMKSKTTVLSCAYRGMELQLHSYLPSALDGGGKLSIFITGKFMPWVRNPGTH